MFFNKLVMKSPSVSNSGRTAFFVRNKVFYTKLPPATLEFSHSQSQAKYSTAAGKEEIIVEVSNGIRKITINRPEKKNALTKAMAITLVSSIAQSNSDEKTKLVVITGNGDYFTSGIDLIGFSGQPKSDDSSSPANVVQPSGPKPTEKGKAFNIFIKSFIECQKPLIALINGPTVGFGVTMLGLFDAVYCSDRATFHTRFTEFGLPPEFCSTYTFPKIMGYVKANHLLLFNNKMNSSEAFDCGLVSKVYAHDVFHEESWRRIEELSKLPVKSLIYSKDLVRGREREYYRKVNKEEQSKFDPQVAREAKKKFEELKVQRC